MDPPSDLPGSHTDSRRPTAGAQGVVARRSLPRNDEAPAIGRAFVAETLRSKALDFLVETAMLLTSELVTNAVVHARSSSTLSLSQSGSTIRVELLDRGHGRVALRRSAPGASGGGRGLFIVEQLSSAWGTSDTPAGTIVWFELSTGGVSSPPRSGANQIGVARSARSADGTTR